VRRDGRRAGGQAVRSANVGRAVQVRLRRRAIGVACGPRGSV
jgi:hypothetical protein